MAANHSGVVSVAGSTPISTSAYTQVFSSTPWPTCQVLVANNTDQNVAIAFGASGSEVDFAGVGKGCTIMLNLGLAQCPAGTRIAVISQGAATTTGYITVSVIS